MSSLESSARAWLAADFDPATKAELERILHEGDEKALHQGFSERMAFGTAGLRGLMGVGPANMNRLVIRQTSAGLADYLLQANPANAKDKGVVIAYDGRHMSKEFAEDTAGVLAARGVKALLYDVHCPTPLGAFAVKYLGAAAGVVVTASHNPPQYNGYKVYQQGGNQINAPVDGLIAAAITRVSEEDPSPKCLSIEEAQKAGKLQYLSSELFDAYRKQLFETVAHPDGPGKAALKIAYTPMHGVGAPYAEAILKQAGFPHVYTVPEQREPDGDFPTVNFPNPEEKGAMDLVIALADAQGAQLAAANDPDADRMSCCARQKDGKMVQLTGDQVGSLLGYHILSTAPKGSWALNTVVSSRLLARIARKWGAQYQETLTGFKWLGAVAKDAEDRGENFAFAYEEALGYMVTPMVWDKDGLSALVALAEFAAKLDTEGKTLWDQVETLHRDFGISVALPRTIRLAPGSKGGDLMVKLRADLPKEIGGHKVILTSDLLENPEHPTDRKTIPKNDVLRFYFADEAYPVGTTAPQEEITLNAPRIIIRPSGTEPKVKIYTEKLDHLREGEVYEEGVQRVTKDLENLVDAFFQYATSL